MFKPKGGKLAFKRVTVTLAGILTTIPVMIPETHSRYSARSTPLTLL